MTIYPTVEFVETPGDFGCDPDALFVEGASRYDRISRGVVYYLVEKPEGMVLVGEDCGTCEDGGWTNKWGCDETPCWVCGGAPILVWYKPCDQCDGEGRMLCECADHVPGDYGCKIGPCPAGCVEINRQWMVRINGEGD